jgi:hypothetical protein
MSAHDGNSRHQGKAKKAFLGVDFAGLHRFNAPSFRRRMFTEVIANQ